MNFKGIFLIAVAVFVGLSKMNLNSKHADSNGQIHTAGRHLLAVLIRFLCFLLEEIHGQDLVISLVGELLFDRSLFFLAKTHSIGMT
ncbi:hypothetical protein PPACK8108_LOCUS10675 [Phakopsora pachyrhizi]|uniref:Secreted protein n=1 Tax=Phakopsora pachyrhizi TaxID=170000 RepID=A0AAV0AYV5_PHAPC|nr:hypothetical protein PPACK8108_LOCUS10672 [Phakopsora pachyrhizi]CAH7675641.1 hypothetical protein PPACK8108_LOCUS10675 [Phakopsora pachyrhizi]